MKFLLEKIDLTEINQLYFLRGYEKDEDDNYCLSMVLMGDGLDEFKAALFLSNKSLTISDGKDLMKYLKASGMKITAEVLKRILTSFIIHDRLKRLKFRWIR